MLTTPGHLLKGIPGLSLQTGMNGFLDFHSF